MVVEGTCAERFTPVREAFAAGFAAGQEVGASVAVVVDGELVVDLWGGLADETTGAPWARDTIVNVWSTTKAMAALCLLHLADHGHLDLHAPVARYWPEFGVRGKEQVEVRHVLGHTAGLPGWDRPTTLAELYDGPVAAAALAGQAPWWKPGSAPGYHAVSQGHLLDEIVRRVTGASLAWYLRTTFSEPLGADFHIGTGAEHDGRIATIVPPAEPMGGGRGDRVSLAARVYGNPVVDGAVANAPAFRRAELPAVNGHGNARSIALIQSVVAGGGEAAGTRFLSEAGVEALFETQAAGVDLVRGGPVRWGMGYGITGPELPIGPNPRACYLGGWGGSMLLIDLDARVTCAYAMNRMSDAVAGDPRPAAVASGLFTALSR